MEDGLRCFHLCRPVLAPSWRGADSHAPLSRQEHTAKPPPPPSAAVCLGGGRDGVQHMHRENCRREAIMRVISEVTQSCTVSSLASMRLQSEFILTQKKEKNPKRKH